MTATTPLKIALLTVTAFYASVLAVLFIALSLLTVRRHRTETVPCVNGGKTSPLRRLRMSVKLSEIMLVAPTERRGGRRPAAAHHLAALPAGYRLNLF